jgi:hypothetical protein
MVTALAMFSTSGCLESGAGPSGPHLPRNLASDLSKSRFSEAKRA